MKSIFTILCLTSFISSIAVGSEICQEMDAWRGPGQIDKTRCQTIGAGVAIEEAVVGAIANKINGTSYKPARRSSGAH